MFVMISCFFLVFLIVFIKLLLFYVLICLGWVIFGVWGKRLINFCIKGLLGLFLKFVVKIIGKLKNLVVWVRVKILFLNLLIL